MFFACYDRCKGWIKTFNFYWIYLPCNSIFGRIERNFSGETTFQCKVLKWSLILECAKGTNFHKGEKPITYIRHYGGN